MSSQPVSGDQWTTISGGVGTAVITDRSATIKRVVMPGTYVGTIDLHDAATIGGTTTTSQIVSFGLPTTSIPQDIELNAKCSNGIVYEATGTPVLTIFWD